MEKELTTFVHDLRENWHWLKCLRKKHSKSGSLKKLSISDVSHMVSIVALGLGKVVNKERKLDWELLYSSAITSQLHDLFTSPHANEVLQLNPDLNYGWKQLKLKGIEYFESKLKGIDLIHSWNTSKIDNTMEGFIVNLSEYFVLSYFFGERYIDDSSILWRHKEAKGDDLLKRKLVNFMFNALR